MADKSSIEWTGATWNPITGCDIASPGCIRCYAMRLAGTRLKNHPSRKGLTQDTKAGPVWTGEVRFNRQWLDQPLHWKRPRKIFVCAHGDLFAENVPDEWIDQVFAVMALAPQHTFQVLTKRAARMREYMTKLDSEPQHDTVRRIARAIPWDSKPPLPEEMTFPLPNVWLGVSAEDQKRADERIPDLLATPAAIRFVSVEPLIGPVDLKRWVPSGRAAKGTGEAFIAPCYFMTKCEHCGWFGSSELCDVQQYHDDADVACPSCRNLFLCDEVDRGLDWIIVGGESGQDARPMHPAWARSLRDQCAAAGVPFFFKQWGAFRPLTRAEHGQACGATLVGNDPHDADAYLLNVGKKAAGRLLDGVEHSEFPNV